jgi:hypothetical protein
VDLLCCLNRITGPALVESRVFIALFPSKDRSTPAAKITKKISPFPKIPFQWVQHRAEARKFNDSNPDHSLAVKSSTLKIPKVLKFKKILRKKNKEKVQTNDFGGNAAAIIAARTRNNNNSLI